MSANKQKSLKINFIMNAILTMSSFVFPLITFPYVSRVLLPSGTGKVSFAMSFITYFSMFAQMGIPTYGIRACAKVRDDKEKLSKTVQEIMIINLIMCVIVYIVYFASLIAIPRIRQDRTLFLIMGSMIAFNAIGVEWLYKALEKYTYITIRSIIFKFIALLLMFALVHSKQDYIIYGGIAIFASSASNIFNFINLRNYINIKLQRDYNFRQHMSMILIFFAMSVAATIYTNLDTVMLGFMKTDTDVGYYNASVKIKSILVSVVTSLGTVLLPRASYYVEQNNLEEFYRISKKALNFIFVIAIPIVVYFILFAEEGVYFLSGKAYMGSILPMRIIMPTVLFIGITNILGIQMMVPLGREKQVLHSEIAGAIVDLVLNTIFIPKYGAAGAALGTVAAEMAVCIWQMSAMRKDLERLFFSIKYWLIFAATAISGIIAMQVKLLETGYFICLLLSGFCFFVVYGVILLIGKEELVIEVTEQLKERITGYRGSNR